MQNITPGSAQCPEQGKGGMAAMAHGPFLIPSCNDCCKEHKCQMIYDLRRQAVRNDFPTPLKIMCRPAMA
eukprot:3943979-Amphidinium_carterae.1